MNLLFDEYEFDSSLFEELLEKAGYGLMIVRLLGVENGWPSLIHAVNSSGDPYDVTIRKGTASEDTVRRFISESVAETENMDAWGSNPWEKYDFWKRFKRTIWNYSDAEEQLVVLAENFDSSALAYVRRLMIDGIPIAAYVYSLTEEGIIVTPKL